MKTLVKKLSTLSLSSALAFGLVACGAEQNGGHDVLTPDQQSAALLPNAAGLVPGLDPDGVAACVKSCNERFEEDCYPNECGFVLVTPTDGERDPIGQDDRAADLATSVSEFNVPPLSVLDDIRNDISIGQLPID